MTEPYEDDPHNPVWERTELILALNDCFEKNFKESALRGNQQNDILACFHGLVEPFSDGETKFYDNLAIFIVGRWASDGDSRAVWQYDTPKGDSFLCTTLKKDAKAIGPVTLSTTACDRSSTFRLGRSNFKQAKSEIFANWLFGDAAVKSNWHTLLGVTLNSEPPATMPKIEE